MEIRKGSGVWASLKILETDTASHAGAQRKEGREASIAVVEVSCPACFQLVTLR